MAENNQNPSMGDTVSPIENELNVIIEKMAGEYDDVTVALNNFKGRVLADYILKLQAKVYSLESLVSLIGSHDGRIMQLLNYIAGAK